MLFFNKNYFSFFHVFKSSNHVFKSVNISFLLKDKTRFNAFFIFQYVCFYRATLC